MEEDIRQSTEDRIQTLDSFIVKAFDSNSNCILIGESHNQCQAMLPLAYTLIENLESYQEKEIAIFYEAYPTLGANNLTAYSCENINAIEDNRYLNTCSSYSD